MKFLRFLLGVIGTVLLVSCGNGSSATPPTDFKVADIGDTQVTLSWTPQPGVEYWVVYRAGDSIELLHDGVIHPDYVYREKVSPPYVVKNLTNGVNYAFTVDARVNGGPGGAGAPYVTAKPSAAGSSWTNSPIALEGSLRAGASGIVSGSSDNFYLGVGVNGTLLTRSCPQLMTASDCYKKQWNPVSNVPSGTANLSGAAYLASKKYLVAVGAAGATFYSTDGLTFTSGTLPTGWVAQDLTDVASNGSMLVAVGKAGTIMTSGDGISWTTQNAQTSQDLKAATYLPVSSAGTGGFWVVAGNAGTVLKSSDAVNWSAIDAFPSISGTKPDINGLAVLAIKNVATNFSSTFSYLVAAVGSDGNTSVLDTDAVTWKSSKMGSQTLNKVAASGGQFLAVGNAGAVYTYSSKVYSSSGTDSWTAQNSSTDKNLVGLFRDPNYNVYVAYSDDNKAFSTIPY